RPDAVRPRLPGLVADHHRPGRGRAVRAVRLRQPREHHRRLTPARRPAIMTVAAWETGGPRWHHGVGGGGIPVPPGRAAMRGKGWGERGRGVLVAVVLAVAAGLANVVNLMTQHKASIGAPKRVTGWRLALYLPRQPLWLLGVAAAVGSFIFQALALHNGPMSVVQPLLVTELVFTLVLRRVWIGQEVAG